MSDLFSKKLPKKNRLNVLPDNPEESLRAKGRFPSWLHRKLPKGGNLFKTNSILEKYNLNTVCEEAKCPNRFYCYTKKTATFLALGKECTRNCGFCDIDFSKTPQKPDGKEPRNIALSCKELGLKHVVITMVARDDLEDQGAHHIAKIIQEVRLINPEVTVEVLTSDLSGNTDNLDTVLSEKPEIFNHNIETVQELSNRVRHKASYARTLEVLNHAKQSKLASFIKSGIMVGLGETEAQVKNTIKDLHQIGCDIITIGQYLQASRLKLRVKQFITPEQFKEFEEYGHSIGVPFIYSGPFIRSSFNADQVRDIINSKKISNINSKNPLDFLT